MLSIINDYLIVLSSVLITVWLLTVLNNLKFFSRRTLFFTLVNTALLGIIFILLKDKRSYSSILYFVVTIITAYFILKINLLKAILGVGLIFILTAVGELLSCILVVNYLKIDLETAQTLLITNIITTAINIMVVACFGLIVKYNKRMKEMVSSQHINKRFQIVLSIYIIGIFAFLILNFIYLIKPEIYTHNIIKVNIVLTISFLLINLFYLFEKQNSLIRYKENEQLRLLIAANQELTYELRRFKHNYLNILHGFSGFIENEEWEELKKYYNEVVAESKKLNNNVFAIQKIKSYPLLGLLSAKIRMAKSRDVDIKLEVLDEIQDLQISMPELCEVLGIYLDNAIEAAELSEEKEVKVTFFKRNSHVVVRVDNTCKELPDMSKILSGCGYSSKGKERGMGLIIANKILSKYENVLFSTYITEDNYFRQEIVIPEEKQ